LKDNPPLGKKIRAADFCLHFSGIFAIISGVTKDSGGAKNT
jgi:hypothetical protein